MAPLYARMRSPHPQILMGYWSIGVVSFSEANAGLVSKLTRRAKMPDMGFQDGLLAIL